MDFVGNPEESGLDLPARGPGRLPGTPVPDPAGDDTAFPPCDAPVEVFDDLNEQFSRGELELDKVLQRFVKVCDPAFAGGAATVPAFLRAAGSGAAPEVPAPAPPPPPRATPSRAAAAPEGRAPGVARQEPRSAAPAPADQAPVLGGRFQLEEPVAAGEIAEVYRARDLHAAVQGSGPAVTLAILAPRALEDPGLLAGILRSAAEAQLEHPARSRILELHRLDGRYVVVADGLDGRSVAPPVRPPQPVPPEAGAGDAGPAAPHRFPARGAALALVALAAVVGALAWGPWPRDGAAPGAAGPAGVPADRPPAAPVAALTAAGPGTAALVPPAPVPPATVPPSPLPPVAAPAAPAAEPAAAPPAAAPRRATPPARLPTVGFASGNRVVVSESTRFILLKVRASGPLRRPVELSVRAVDGSARVNQDFVPPASRLSLTPQRPVANVLVSLLADTTRENAEDFSVELATGKGSARLGTSRTVVIVNDDD